jgi:nitrite reductase/ring-hydroxylating ferredoxin subunit
MPTKIELCNASDVEAGAVLKIERDDLTLAVFNLDGEFFVTDDHCTHGPGSLSEGFVDGDVVECNFHGGQFNIRRGRRPPVHGSDQDLSHGGRRRKGLHRGVTTTAVALTHPLSLPGLTWQSIPLTEIFFLMDARVQARA